MNKYYWLIIHCITVCAYTVKLKRAEVNDSSKVTVPVTITY